MFSTERAKNVGLAEEIPFSRCPLRGVPTLGLLSLSHRYSIHPHIRCFFPHRPCEPLKLSSTCNSFLGTGKRGHYERGLFTGGLFRFRISKVSKSSRISRKWLASPLFSTVRGFSKISRISKFSRISRNWTFLKRPLFQKTPFSEPDFRLIIMSTLPARPWLDNRERSYHSFLNHVSACFPVTRVRIPADIVQNDLFR